MCSVYAGQLEDAGEVSKASTYLIAIKKIKEAATMLLKHNYFREALAVVKSQENQDNINLNNINQDNKLVLEIITKWAEYNNNNGHPKEAAHW